MNVRRSIAGRHPGPTAGELRDLIDGVPDHAQVSITYDRGYNQFDPGGWTLSVSVPT